MNCGGFFAGFGLPDWFGWVLFGGLVVVTLFGVTVALVVDRRYP